LGGRPRHLAFGQLSFIKRNRIISTRVSEDEYEEVQRISRKHGAHSVSDYLRQVMMTGPGHPAAEAGTQEAEIAALQRKVEWLLHVVERSDGSGGPEPIGSTADAKRDSRGTEKRSPGDNGLPCGLEDDV